jgi:hypothetical protein
MVASADELGRDIGVGVEAPHFVDVLIAQGLGQPLVAGRLDDVSHARRVVFSIVILEHENRVPVGTAVFSDLHLAPRQRLLEEVERQAQRVVDPEPVRTEFRSRPAHCPPDVGENAVILRRSWVPDVLARIATVVEMLGFGPHTVPIREYV